MPNSNPYAATDHTETYYGEFIDSIPFGAFVNLLSHNIPRPIAWSIVAWLRLKYWCGRPTLPTAATGAIGSAIKLPQEDMPKRAMSRWAAKLEQLSDLGFQPIEFCVEVHIGAKESTSALFLDSPKTTFVSLEWFRMPGAEGIEERTTVEFNSLLQLDIQKPPVLDSDPVIAEVTTLLSRKDESALQEAFTVEGVDQEFLIDTTPLRKAYETHCRRLQAYDPRSIELTAASEAYRELETKRLEWMLFKGYLRKLTPKQIEVVKRNQLEVG